MNSIDMIGCYGLSRKKYWNPQQNWGTNILSLQKLSWSLFFFGYIWVTMLVWRRYSKITTYITRYLILCMDDVRNTSVDERRGGGVISDLFLYSQPSIIWIGIFHSSSSYWGEPHWSGCKSIWLWPKDGCARWVQPQYSQWHLSLLVSIPLEDLITWFQIPDLMTVPA